MAKPNEVSDVPNDIVVEILSRSPVKSLMRFKCVSKTWLSLISDPYFALLHLRHASASSRSNLKILVPNPTSASLQSLDCSITSFSDEGAFLNLDFPLRFKCADDGRPGFLKIIGSCNGLVCIALNGYDSFFIWNPVTGAYTKLPDVFVPEYGDHSSYTHGFAYDSSSNDYKVFFCSRHVNDSFIDAKIDVFATKTGSWKRIEHNFSISSNCRYHWQTSSVGSLLNGTLHWLTIWFCYEHVEYRMITAFDLAEEKFLEVPMPAAAETEDIYFDTLGVLDGCLCLLVFPNSDAFELWMMKEYGLQSSWEKLFRFTKLEETKHIGRLVPLSFTRKDDVILINYGKEWIRCNPEEETLERVMIASGGTKVYLEATPYRESLISPTVFL